MTKKNLIIVKDANIRTMTVNGVDLGIWEILYNPNFKGVEFDPLLAEAGSNAFTMSPTKQV